MHFLLTNDDGINAPGIRALADAALRRGHTFCVAAPDRERSAASHSVTLRTPLRADKVDYPGATAAYAIDGTPADCARVGLWLLPDVDMVLSGINNGPNLGAACIYSGTVGAATEAAMCNYQAIATSMSSYNCKDYTAGAEVTVRLAEWAKDHPLPRGAVYNLNIPDIPYDEIKGVRNATLGPMFVCTPAAQAVETPEGVRYAYKLGENVPYEDPECDFLVIREGWATLTKVCWNVKLNAPDADLTDLSLENAGERAKPVSQVPVAPTIAYPHPNQTETPPPIAPYKA
ncbi:MAG: 5'/3'-nucleotidase SurE [Clostridia bacterium]|nr:5'/3'-nucleotidase SurE [Clostridia bacterium]